MAESLERWRIVATGTVQLVNYRERVQHAAVAHHITGDVENDKRDDERVLIEAQGTPGDLLDFLEAIRGPEGRSDAREVLKTKDLEPDPALARFQIKRGRTRQETLERVEFARHALTTLSSEVESLRGEFKTQVKEIDESIASLTKAAASATAAQADRDRASQKAQAALVDDLSRALSALGKKLDAASEAQVRSQRETGERFERLEAAHAALAKSLLAITKALEDESEEQERQARSAEQQRAALLHLAGQLSGPGPSLPRRRRGLR